MTTATFINERNCLVPRDFAMKIGINRENYRAETPVSLLQEPYDIHSVFYKSKEDAIAADWGVVKVSYKI